MQKLKLAIACTMASLVLAAGVASAKVSEEEASRLGQDLTPFGGEVAGNEANTIPAWTGKWKGLPPGLVAMRAGYSGM